MRNGKSATKNRVTETTCPSCGKKFLPRRPGQTFDSLACYRASRRDLTERECPGCKKVFLPGYLDQCFCSAGCRQAHYGGQETRRTLVDYVRKKPWRVKDPDSWGVNDLWAWAVREFQLANQPIQVRLDKRGLGQLQNLRKYMDNGNGTRGVGIDLIRSVVRYCALNYGRYQASHKLEMFTPGILLGFWHTFSKDMLGTGGAERKWEEGPSLADTDADASADYGSLADTEPDEVPASPRKGRVTVRNWRDRPEEQWTPATLWQFLYDSLTSSGVLAVQPTQWQVKKLRTAMEEKAIPMPDAITVARLLVENYRRCYGFYQWSEPFSPNIFAGYYPPMRKFFAKTYPARFEEARDDSQ